MTNVCRVKDAMRLGICSCKTSGEKWRLKSVVENPREISSFVGLVAGIEILRFAAALAAPILRNCSLWAPICMGVQNTTNKGAGWAMRFSNRNGLRPVAIFESLRP